ncbi:hypothetical protein GQ53DRAFT_810535 [Thozetella sp. PMI_491]|nr:hypothetical protein GQ53DRAFT_810535 [Thozetella sp. PMI_491]
MAWDANRGIFFVLAGTVGSQREAQRWRSTRDPVQLRDEVPGKLSWAVGLDPLQGIGDRRCPVRPALGSLLEPREEEPKGATDGGAQKMDRGRCEDAEGPVDARLISAEASLDPRHYIWGRDLTSPVSSQGLQVSIGRKG